MPRVLAAHSDLLTIPPNVVDDRDEQDSQESKQATAPVDAQCPEHLGSKQWKASTKARPHEVVPR